MNNDEVADIKNKLQSCLTVLELLKEGKEPPENIVSLADENLRKAILILDKKRG